jgi:hypothetical protein
MSRLTRRDLLGALAAAAAAAVALPRRDPDERPPDRWAGSTRWIGHC